MTVRLRTTPAHTLFAVLVTACAGPAATPIVVYVTPEPTPVVTPSPSPSPTPEPTSKVITQACADELSATRDALDELDARLDVGLNFDEYSDQVGDISVANNRQDIDDLSAEGADCIAVALMLNEAFLEYIDANDIWNDCIGDVDCDTDSIDPDLQRHWSAASDKLDEAGEWFP